MVVSTAVVSVTARDLAISRNPNGWKFATTVHLWSDLPTGSASNLIRGEACTFRCELHRLFSPGCAKQAELDPPIVSTSSGP
jgi:hypothetical protein